MTTTSPNFEDFVGKMKLVQDKFQEMQKRFSDRTIQGFAGVADDEKIFVNATVDGNRILKTLEVGEGVWALADKQICIDLIIGAVNNATERLREDMQQEMKQLYEQYKVNELTEG